MVVGPHPPSPVQRELGVGDAVHPARHLSRRQVDGGGLAGILPASHVPHLVRPALERKHLARGEGGQEVRHHQVLGVPQLLQPGDGADGLRLALLPVIALVPFGSGDGVGERGKVDVVLSRIHIFHIEE